MTLYQLFPVLAVLLIIGISLTLLKPYIEPTIFSLILLITVLAFLIYLATGFTPTARLLHAQPLAQVKLYFSLDSFSAICPAVPLFRTATHLAFLASG